MDWESPARPQSMGTSQKHWKNPALLSVAKAGGFSRTFGKIATGVQLESYEEER